jgi:hypothetical protein
MLTWAKAALIKTALGRVAKDPDTQTTVLGVIAAALISEKLDWGKLLSGDPDQVGTAIGVLVVALFGFITNRRKKTA